MSIQTAVQNSRVGIFFLFVLNNLLKSWDLLHLNIFDIFVDFFRGSISFLSLICQFSCSQILYSVTALFALCAADSSAPVHCAH